MNYPQARLWLLLLGSLLSCQVSWAQDSSVGLIDPNLVMMSHEQDNSRAYLLEDMHRFAATHGLHLLITFLEQDGIYERYVRRDETSLLSQSAPTLVITTWHSSPSKSYQRCEVQVNEALAARLPQPTAQQLAEEMLDYYGSSVMIPSNAMYSGLSTALLKLSEYLNALPPPEATPTITFANAPAVGDQPVLGLDAFTYEVYRPHYEQVRINEEPYPVAWKALPSGGTTSVLTQVEKGVSFPPGVVFRQDGNTLSSQPATQNHQQQLTLTGQMHEQEGSLEVYASREEDAALVGKLRTISYDVLYKRLVLVVLDDVTSDMLYLDRVSRAVQAIFVQAGVSLTIEIQKFDTEWVDREVPLKDETSGMLSNYPKELKRVIKDYRQEHEQEAETAYIFLAGSSSTGKLGYMPKKRPYGFVYRNAHYYAEEVAKTIAHELGHGLFRLEHTFEAYPALTKGSTDNLMDYGKGTRLHKYQWDLVHDPKAMLGWFQDEEENAYYTLQEVKKLLEEIKKNNEKRKGNVLKTSRAIVTTKDLTDEAWLATNLQDSWLPANLIRNLATDKAIRESLENKPEENYGLFSPYKVLINPTTDRHAILLAKEVKVMLDEQAIAVTVHGYAPTNRMFTNYVARQKHDNNVTLTFFNYEKPISNTTNNKSLSDVSNIRKAFAITVVENDVQAIKNYLNIFGEIDWDVTEEAVDNDKIVIEVTRTKSNEFITTGEIAIRGTNVRGATLELGKGTIQEECTSCPDNTAHNCKRIPAGTYNFELNTTKGSSKGQHVYHSIRLTDTKGKVVDGHTSERDGVLIHRGNSYSFIQGCILAMYHEELPSVLEDVDSYLNRDIMGYRVSDEERTVMPLLIYEYINKVDPDGTKKKTVIIRNEDEDNLLRIDTQKFEKRKEAGEYYISLDINTKIEAVFVDLAYEITKDLLAKKGIVKAINEKKIELLQNDALTVEQKQEEINNTWNSLITEKTEEITDGNAVKLVKDYNKRFLQLSKESIITSLKTSGIENDKADEIWNYMHDSKYGGSPPGTPFKQNFLGSSGDKWQKTVKAIVRKSFSTNVDKCKKHLTTF